MTAKVHSSFWGWASDHWFLTFLMGSAAISGVVTLFRGYEPPNPALTAWRVQPPITPKDPFQP